MPSARQTWRHCADGGESGTMPMPRVSPHRDSNAQHTQRPSHNTTHSTVSSANSTPAAASTRRIFSARPRAGKSARSPHSERSHRRSPVAHAPQHAQTIVGVAAMTARRSNSATGRVHTAPAARHSPGRKCAAHGGAHCGAHTPANGWADASLITRRIDSEAHRPDTHCIQIETCKARCWSVLVQTRANNSPDARARARALTPTP